MKNSVPFKFGDITYHQSVITISFMATIGSTIGNAREGLGFAEDKIYLVSNRVISIFITTFPGCYMCQFMFKFGISNYKLILEEEVY